jgi:hypothetical protein
MEKVLNDHIMMKEPRGVKPKAVPCWQIEQWIKIGKFNLSAASGNTIGWDFVDPENARADYAAWLHDKARKAAIAAAKTQLGAVPAPAGIAGAAHDAAVRDASGAVFGTPDVPDVPSSPPVPKAKPKDVI